jgi:hypothetical protein
MAPEVPFLYDDEPLSRPHLVANGAACSTNSKRVA